MDPFPKDVTEQSVVDVVRQITRFRDKDITDRNTFPAIFLSGRSVNKIPTSHTDVAVTDRVGDFNVTPTFAYYLVNDAGTPKWGRFAVSVTW